MKRRSGTLLLVAAMAAGALAVLALRPAEGQPASSSWPMFQHDAQHRGRSPFVGPQDNTVRCQFQVTGAGVGSPVIGSDGTIYLPSGTINDDVGFLYAINPDCTQKWVFELPGPPASTAPALASDGTIYIHANGPQNLVSVETLTAINADGTLKWQFEFNGGLGMFTSWVQSSPAVAPDGTIYVGSMDTYLYALNPDGSIKWAVSPTWSSIMSSPAIGPDGTIYVVDGILCDLLAFAPNGDSLWSYALFSATCDYGSSPAVGADGTIYIGSPGMGDPSYGYLHAVKPNGTLKCRFSAGQSIASTPAIAADGTIYVGSDFLYAVNPDCSQKWKFQGMTISSHSASPAIGADGTIYWGDGWRRYGVNPDGTEKWSLVGVAGQSGLDPSGAIGADGALYQGSAELHGGSRDSFLFVIGPPLASPVGGIAELPDVAQGSSSPRNFIVLAGFVAVALAALTAGAWYARRRRLG